MNIPLFSIISPIYNASAHLRNAFEQITRQSFTNFEWILIDDGSTDDSLALLHDLQALDDRLVVLHESNQGSGPARNLGIDHARGKWVVFYDVDDQLESNLLERVAHHVEGNDSTEVLVFGYDSYDVFYKTLTIANFPALEMQSNHEVRAGYVDHLMGLRFSNGFVWNKVFGREFLNKHRLRMPALLIQQDEVFCLEVYRHAEHIKIIPDVLYHYYVYSCGNTRSRFISNRLDIYSCVIQSFLALYDDWQLSDERMLRYVYRRFFQNIIDSLNLNCFCDEVERVESSIIKMITRHDVMQCVAAMQRLHIVPDGGRQKRYFEAIASQNVRAIAMLHRWDEFWGKFKRELHRLYNKLR